MNASQKIEMRNRIALEAWKTQPRKPPFMRKTDWLGMTYFAMEKYAEDLEKEELDVKKNA